MKLARRKELTPSGLVRAIVLEHIRGGTRTFWDDGCNSRGEPNQGRQCILRALAKSVRVEDGGEAFDVPVYRLAKQPDPIPYNLADRKQADRAARDRFDDEHLKQAGDKGRQWIFPGPGWVEARKAVMAEDERIEKQFLEQQKASQGKHVAEILGQVMLLAEAGKGQARGKAAQVGAGT